MSSPRFESLFATMPVEAMRTLLVCRGPIAFETLEVYRRCHWQLPHVVVSSKEWIAELQRAAPWIVDMPADHVHYVQEYNDVEAVLQIAAAHDIDAIYPGYGFLAENADFADRVEQTGIRFIGPTPDTLRAVGDKDSAITLAKQLDIPTIPGDDALVAYAQTQRQEATAAETIRRVLALAQQYPGYPIRLKHPAGGGGKGQRVLVPDVLQSNRVAEAIRDALVKLWGEMGVSTSSADAHKGVLLELNLPRPLHWEVQLFGDGETVVHFAARDCSLQNHGYQKFIELALHPQAIAAEIDRLAVEEIASPALLDSLRQRQKTLERICADALRLGQAIHLRGAATVEFLIDEQGEPYFLEVNPRIQVEHAVTEGIARVHGLPISLVELQQRVAAGERLNFAQADVTFDGDAIEVRLNAWHEDLSPVLGGVVHALRLEAQPTQRQQARIDASGLLQRQQAWIVPSYDANFALIIVPGDSRHAALDALLDTLKHDLQVQGNTELHTNLQPVIGLLTFMRSLPPETAFRTDVSLLWMALVAMVMAQRQAVMSHLPAFPRRPTAYDPAIFSRLLKATLETGFAHPSRLLAYYIKRLMQPVSRPLAALEVMWQLAEELDVPMYEEERPQGEVFRQASDLLWTLLSRSVERFTVLCGTASDALGHNPDYVLLIERLQTGELALTAEEATALLQEHLAWLQVPVPAIRTLIEVLEHTQMHELLAANDDLSLTRPAYLEDAATVAQLHRLLSQALRPTTLRAGELLSPMEATVYHRPEPDAPPFVEIGMEVAVGQTLLMLEAMKMFSELPSPVDGVIVDILVDDGQGVKTGEPLFKIATQDTAVDLSADHLPPLLTDRFRNHFGLLRIPDGSPGFFRQEPL